MPEIRIAREAGACYGVGRALDMVRKAALAAPGHVRTLGPLIHNPTVVADLDASGVEVVEQPCEAEGNTLVLRTHGVTPEVESAARKACTTVIDATCPFVKRAHNAAELLSREGYQLIVVGEVGHPEVEGTVGHAPEALVVGDASELKDVNISRRVGMVVQTTMTQDRVQEIMDALLPLTDELRVVNTICEATSSRQRAAAELATEANVMIVIGGRNSANTTHLAEICAEHCKKTHHIEGPSELEADWFVDAGLVGITAGASTPTDQIDAVRNRIAKLCAEAR